ncbi:hypothetical protein [Paraburkholderia terrae]|uniref:Uncharacterized protein n=1 Tax=Paraburkholderia terrae TaxID=311230 RepID=A0A2I8EX66_9BURK|nr:hypothetical protein [Paraburkholderia terrae]AUT64069.1 hypothetical protein C2L65_30500 [Paraburkholderia terrae]
MTGTTDSKGSILSKQLIHRAGSNAPNNGILRTPWGYIARSIALVVLAVSPSVICAYLAQTSAHWSLFERSGSIVTIIGLLLASRHYFAYTVTDLVVARTNEGAGFKARKVLSDVLAARRGLTLSAFGTLIWGWGIFLRWWSFALLALWMAFVIYRVFRDPVLQRRRDNVLPRVTSVDKRFRNKPEQRRRRMIPDSRPQTDQTSLAIAFAVRRRRRLARTLH